jgi:hypothetical protein
MSLLNWLPSPIANRHINAWGVEVAQQCQSEVALRLGQSVHRLSLSAARGYIQARSATVLDEEIALLVEQTGCTSAVAIAVRHQAMDEIIRMAVGDLLKTTHSAVLRKAA